MKFPLEMNKVFLVFFIFFFQNVQSQDVPPTPNPARLVNDLYGLLPQAEQAVLEQKLLAYNDSTSSELVIVIEASSHGRETMEYATELFSSWKIGKKGKDNGILIYVGVQDRSMAIVTGYGMEGAVPDAATFTIREKIMKPKFRNGEFYQGLDQATTAIFLLAAGEYTADELKDAFKQETRSLRLGLVIFVIVILIIIFSNNYRRKGPKSIGRPLSPWEMLILGGGMSRTSGGWSDFSNGSGSFGGGGFGGFGGGMTGGGGSAGSW